MALQPFLDELPIPRVLKPKARSINHTYYEVKMKEIFHQFHKDLSPTKAWGYEGQIPGPTIEVEQGECTHVKWMNNLPGVHFLPIDHSIHGAGKEMPGYALLSTYMERKLNLKVTDTRRPGLPGILKNVVPAFFMKLINIPTISFLPHFGIMIMPWVSHA